MIFLTVPGAGGLGAALLAAQLGRCCDVHITDCDSCAVDMIRYKKACVLQCAERTYAFARAPICAQTHR